MTTTHEITTSDIARICHEANTALQVALGEVPSPHWDDIDDDMRSSAIRGVTLALDDGATPEGLHESWVETKAEQGWAYGETKDSDAKTHPCMVPYADLPQDQRMKDHLFAAIVRLWEY